MTNNEIETLVDGALANIDDNAWRIYRDDFGADIRFYEIQNQLIAGVKSQIEAGLPVDVNACEVSYAVDTDRINGDWWGLAGLETKEDGSQWITESFSHFCMGIECSAEEFYKWNAEYEAEHEAR